MIVPIFSLSTLSPNELTNMMELKSTNDDDDNDNDEDEEDVYDSDDDSRSERGAGSGDSDNDAGSLYERTQEAATHVYRQHAAASDRSTVDDDVYAMHLKAMADTAPALGRGVERRDSAFAQRLLAVRRENARLMAEKKGRAGKK